jgi:hypothetical protein
VKEGKRGEVEKTVKEKEKEEKKRREAGAASFSVWRSSLARGDFRGLSQGGAEAALAGRE